MAGEHETRTVYFPPFGQEVTVDVTVVLASPDVARRIVTQGWLADGSELPARHFEDVSRLLWLSKPGKRAG